MNSMGTRARFVLLVVIAGLPALAVTAYSSWDERARAELRARDDLRRFATLAAQRQEQIIEGARQTLAAIAHIPVGSDIEQVNCNAYLAKLRAQSAGIYHSMGFYRADATLICNALPWTGTVVSPERLYISLARTSAKLAIGDYQVGRVTGLKGINVGYPVIDAGGAVTAVSFVAINLARLSQMAAATPLPEQSILTIIDRDGVILARAPEQADRIGAKLQIPAVLNTVLAARSGIFQAQSADGVERLWAFETVADNPDGVVPIRALVSIPMSVIFAEADRALIRDLLGLALATALMLIAAWYGTGVVVLRKVRILLDTARSVHAGNLGARTGMQHGGAELSQIGAAFDEMAQALQDRERELKRVLEALSEQATTDPLTGLYNRRFLAEFLQQELARAGRSGAPVAVVILDLDHFKGINDNFGHAAGDLVLTETAELLRRNTREGDIVCRYGGEEFVLILIGASRDGARNRAETIRMLIKNQVLEYNNESLGVISASFGMAFFPENAGDATTLLHCADLALYEAKESGRDRVVVSTAVPEVPKPG